MYVVNIFSDSVMTEENSDMLFFALKCFWLSSPWYIYNNKDDIQKLQIYKIYINTMNWGLQTVMSNRSSPSAHTRGVMTINVHISFVHFLWKAFTEQKSVLK